MTFRSNFDAGELLRGCVLATIAHAIFTPHNPELANEQSWDGFNYNVQDSQGTLGTISFDKEVTVGAFFDGNSTRNPFRSGDDYDVSVRLAEMPSRARTLADRETLQYLLQDYKGADVPIITAAFWGEGGALAAAEPWQDVMSNGGHLVKTQLQPIEEAIEVWRTHYGFTASQTALLRSIFARKTLSNEGPIVLSGEEKGLLLMEGVEGIEKSRELLSGIGITLP